MAPRGRTAGLAEERRFIEELALRAAVFEIGPSPDDGTVRTAARSGEQKGFDPGLSARVAAGQPADEGAIAIPVGGSASGTIGSAGDADTITFSVVSGQTYVISMQGSGGAPLDDSLLTLFNRSGVEVGSDDDGGIGRDSLITFTATTTGTWSVAAEGFDDATGGYTVDLRRIGADSVPGGFATTVSAPLDATTLGAIETNGDVDVYAVTLAGGALYDMHVAGGADYTTDSSAVPVGELDTIITIYDAAGNEVASNDDLAFPDDVSSGVFFAPDASGTYYVRIEAYPGQTGGYALRIDELDLSGLDPLDTIDWGTRVEAAAVTVYFAAAGETFDGTTSLGWTAYERTRAMAAFEEYAQVAGLAFSVTTDPGAATFKLVTTNSDEFLGYFNPPGEFNEGVGVFAINGPGWDRTGTTGGLAEGGYGYVTLVHEIGHGLGLAHPHDNGGSSEVMPGVTGDFGSPGVFDLNQGIHTTMSYNDGWFLHPDAVGGRPPTDPIDYGWQGGPMAFDIALIQQKYGAAAHSPGNSVYTLPTANAAGTFWTCLWDTGGIDTIRHGGAAPALIDLTAATLDYSPTGGGVVSYVEGVFGGFTIAHGVVIENATGGGGDDVLIGNAADNFLRGGGGTDIMRGGGGNDRYSVDDAGDAIAEPAGGGADRVFALVSYALAAGVQVETLSTGKVAGSAPIDLTGNDFANILIGNAGANRLSGGGGADLLIGHGGNDRFVVDDLADRVRELAGGGFDRVLAAGDYTLGAGVRVELLSTLDPAGAAPLALRGNGRFNRITGNAGDNLLDGGGGADRLTGGDGHDRFLVDQRGDVVVEGAGGGFDQVVASASYALARGVRVEAMQADAGSGSIDLVGNEFGNRLVGNAGNNRLRGAGGRDTLSGLNGSDFLNGGAGADDLTGGGGADRFAFSSRLSATANVDTILDFSVPSDSIILDRTTFEAIGANGALASGAFRRGMTAQDATDVIIYNAATGRIFYDPDGAGGADAILFARVDPGTALTSADFIAVA